MTHSDRWLDRFAGVRNRLAASLEVIAGVFESVEADASAKDIRHRRQLLLEDVFRILVYGAMKRGKSTIINAMLGEPLLPTAVSPCTAIPCCVKFGEPKRAVLYRRPPHPPETVDLVRDPGALRARVTIQYPDTGEESSTRRSARVAESQREHPFIEADIYAMLELLRPGVEIQDTPGLDEDAERTEESRARERTADAVLFVLACDYQIAQTECAEIKRILIGRDPRDMFFVINKYDGKVRDDPEEAANLRRRVAAVLRPLVGDNARIHFVSAEEGLQGRSKGKVEILNRSGMLEFERELGGFLTDERSTVKLRAPLRVAEAAVHQGLMELLFARERMMRAPLDRVDQNIMAVMPKLREAEKQRDGILAAADRRTNLIAQEVSLKFRQLGNELQDGVAEALVGVELSLWDSIAKRNDAKRRLAEQVAKWAGKKTEAWQTESLSPMLERHIRELGDDVRSHVGELDRQLRAAKEAVGGVIGRGDVSHEDELSAPSRLLGAGLGVLGGAGSILEGATLGVGAAARGLLVNIVAGAVLSVVVGLSWPLIVTGLALVGMIRVLMGADSEAKRLRSKVSEELKSALRSKLPEMEAKVVQLVRDDLAKHRAKIESALDAPIAEISEKAGRLEREREGLAAELRVTMQRLDAQRRLLNAQVLELAEIRRLVEPESDPVGLATRLSQELEAKVTEAMAKGRAGDGVAGVARERIVLDHEAKGRLRAVGAYFTSVGRWNREREEKLAEWWTWFPRSEGGPRDVQTWRIVSALAVVSEQDSPPDKKEFREQWRNDGYRHDFIRLFWQVGGSKDDPIASELNQNEDPHPAGPNLAFGGHMFYTAYDRVHKVVEGWSQETRLRPETLPNHDERDPYRKPVG